MKRGHIILISGAVLFVAGIIISAVWAIPFAGSFLRDTTMVAKTSIDPGKSLDTRIEVHQLDRPISLAIGIDRTGEQPQTQVPPSAPSFDIRLKEVVTDPNGRVISNNEFGDSFFTSFKPDVVGVYIITVSNLGTKPVSVSGAFGYMSFVGQDGKPDINSMMGAAGLGMIITGGALAAVGVVILIVGAIITIVDSRNRRQSSTTTSEDGITYRKD